VIVSFYDDFVDGFALWCQLLLFHNGVRLILNRGFVNYGSERGMKTGEIDDSVDVTLERRAVDAVRRE
jgi:hypothetical protein